MPKSKVRKKAVYTPPPRSSKANVSPPWLVPTMLGCLIVGLAWIATFYVSGQKLPVEAISQWNLVVQRRARCPGCAVCRSWCCSWPRRWRLPPR